MSPNQAESMTRLVGLVGGQIPQFQQPDRIVPNVIELLHRGDDGHVCFSVRDKETGKIRPFRGVLAKKLKNILPGFEESLDEDSFYTINGFYKHNRKTKDARYLNACFVDIDPPEDSGMTGGDVAAYLIKGMVDGNIPMASVLKLSGRGCWAIWLLHDPNDPSKPLKAFSDQRAKYAAVEGAIAEHFAAIGGDPNAKDIARLTRIEGSVNTKTANRDRVSYSIMTDERGQVYSYTLDDLKEAFNVRYDPSSGKQAAIQWSKPMTDGKSEGWKRERAIKGHLGLWQKRMDDIETLAAYRGGIKEGSRYYACWFLAICMKKVGYTNAEIEQNVRRLASACVDRAGKPCPLDESDIKEALESAKTSAARFKQETITRLMGIKPEEDHLLATLSSQPKKKGEDDPLGAPSRKEQTKLRRQFLASLDKPISVRKARAVLDYRCGLKASNRTIQSDFEAIGWTESKTEIINLTLWADDS